MNFEKSINKKSFVIIQIYLLINLIKSRKKKDSYIEDTI